MKQGHSVDKAIVQQSQSKAGTDPDQKVKSDQSDPCARRGPGWGYVLAAAGISPLALLGVGLVFAVIMIVFVLIGAAVLWLPVKFFHRREKYPPLVRWGVLGLALAVMLVGVIYGVFGVREVAYGFSQGSREKGNLQLAFGSCWLAAEAGHVPAMCDLGSLYSHGDGVLPDRVEAFRWTRKAAEKGDRTAMLNLATMYANGHGVLKDNDSAVVWYRRAADAGEPTAMGTLGSMYADGVGVEKNAAEAIKWFTMAAGAGDITAMDTLGQMYENGGLGMKADATEAVKWYRRAADAGDALTMTKLGTMYQDGQGVPRDDVEAVKWYSKAADANEASGMVDLALMYEFGLGGLAKDHVLAIQWMQRAADKGTEQARQWLAKNP